MAESKSSSFRALGEMFQCGKTQIAYILKKKDSILAQFESKDVSPTSRRSRSCEPYAELNKALYEWYIHTCAVDVCPGGPRITEKALEIAAQMGKTEFKGSNGWLEKWKKRYNIKQISLRTNQAGDLHGLTVDIWNERLPKLLHGYRSEDVWNLDEMSLLWSALPDKRLAQIGVSCELENPNEHRVTILFIVNANGGKETPIVIGKPDNPGALNDGETSQYPVMYFNQTNAWMSSDILDRVLTRVNCLLCMESRSVLLLLNTASCHPLDIKYRYSNIKIMFIPTHLATYIQPLSLGVVRSFRANYRYLFLRYVATKNAELHRPFEIANSVDIVLAMKWIAQAWEQVSEVKVCEAFRQANILLDDVTVPTYSSGSDVDIEPLIESSMSMIMPSEELCSVDEYINFDEKVQVCLETSISLSSPAYSTRQQTKPPPTLKIKNTSEALMCLKDVREFLLFNSDGINFSKLGDVISSLERMEQATK